MAMVYDNVKGSFKDGQQKKEKNNSGMMSKELSSLSNAGPTNHSLAYITPEEEKLLAKATGKETITTAYGIPTYESEMTAEEMESKLKNKQLPSKEKSFFNRPEEGESSMEKIASGTATMDDKYSLFPAMNIMGYEIPGPRALLQEHIVKPLMNYLSKNKEEFNPTKDYHLNKFLLKKQQEMQSTEDYIPPQP